MNKKQKFVNLIQEEIFNNNLYADKYQEDWKDIVDFWNDFTKEKENIVTKNGKKILLYLQENSSISDWKARDIAEGLFISSRSISGTLRKLVTDGYVGKKNSGTGPSIYFLTEKGFEYKEEN